MTTDIRKAAEPPLRPCPFCGGEPYSCRHLSYSNWGVACQCGATGPTKNAGYRPLREAEIRAHNEAVEAWNQRAALAAEQPQPEAVAWPKVNGTARMFDNARALMVIMEREPTDDEMRAFDDAIKGWGTSPPAAPEPSEAEVAAAMASLHRAMEPAAWPSEDEITDALRAAAAARNTNPA